MAGGAAGKEALLPPQAELLPSFKGTICREAPQGLRGQHPEPAIRGFVTFANNKP